MTKTSANARPLDYGQPTNLRTASMYSSTADLPAGADYWRDASPLGPNHSSRNLRQMPSNPSLRHSESNSNLIAPQHRIQSMAGMSMWGAGSEYGGAPHELAHQQQMTQPFMYPMMTGMSMPQSMPHPASMYGSPAGYAYGSPLPSDYGLRPQTMFGPYGSQNAPRNSVMTNLGAMGMDPNRMSSYSLATTAQQVPPNPFAGGTPGTPGSLGVGARTGASEPLMVDEKEDPTDDEVVAVLKRYLAQQDLMSV
jgi:chitin synthase